MTEPSKMSLIPELVVNQPGDTYKDDEVTRPKIMTCGKLIHDMVIDALWLHPDIRELSELRDGQR